MYEYTLAHRVNQVRVFDPLEFTGNLFVISRGAETVFRYTTNILQEMRILLAYLLQFLGEPGEHGALLGRRTAFGAALLGTGFHIKWCEWHLAS
jgi:hypothetical protein